MALKVATSAIAPSVKIPIRLVLAKSKQTCRNWDGGVLAGGGIAGDAGSGPKLDISSAVLIRGDALRNPCDSWIHSVKQTIRRMQLQTPRAILEATIILIPIFRLKYTNKFKIS